MFNKKNNELKVEEYINTLIDCFRIRKHQFHIDHKSNIKMEEKDFERLHDKLVPVINKIINNGNDFILTKEQLDSAYLEYKKYRS